MNIAIRNLVVAMMLGLVVILASSTTLAQGLFLPASGAINRGMGGATTGTAIDAIGSMYWNPATISAFDSDEMAFGFEVIYPNLELSSAFPGSGSGATDAENGVSPIPTIAWVHHLDETPYSLGLGIFGVAGFGANLPGDAKNPILSAPFAMGGTGLGGIRTEALFFEMNPALSAKVTDQLSVAAGPVIGLGRVSLDENPFVGANANGLYPRGDGTRYSWGLGAQVGLHYVHDCCWEFGANVKTPTWFEPFRYFSEDAAGQPRTDKVNFTLPLIVTGGVAYKGLESTILTADLRYLNYADTDGLGEATGYRANGAVTGLGYRDQFSLALGAQREITERLTGRVGYIYASKLLNSSDTFFNVASDLGYQHVPTMGATYQLSESTSVSMAYNYLIPWGSTGPYVLPGVGAVPGSSVSTRLDTHIATLGVNVRY